MNALKSLIIVCGCFIGAVNAAERIIDLGQVEIEGELRRPQVKWVDSSKRMKDLLPRIHGERFAAIEKKLLAPMSATQVTAWLKTQQKVPAHPQPIQKGQNP